MIIRSWSHLTEVVSSMSEDELRESINHECNTYKRKAILTRLHSRYGQLMLKRQRAQLLTWEYNL